MLVGVLVELDRLRPHLEEVRRRAREGDSTVRMEMLEGDAGEALAYSLLFERWPELVGPLDAESQLYNRYFWFVRFVTLWTQRNASDAGLEQQVHQVLEHAEGDVDWALIERLDAMARGRS